MRVLSIAERELRAAARHRGLYHIRWIAAAAAFGFLLWLGWAFDVFQNKSAGPQVFRTFAACIFVYCLFVGAAATADCVSRERREGTLGLLFLTNLNSAEIVTGKLCANGLAVMYSLIAILPVLALPVLMGGVTLAEFWRTVLALVNAMFFAVAAGFAASSVCVRQFPAVALATGLALGVGGGLVGLAEALRNLGVSRSATDWIATFSPLQTLFAAFEVRRFNGPARFWFSLPAVAAMSWALLLVVAWRLSRTWRDRPKSVRRWPGLQWQERRRELGRDGRTAFRRRMLGINPFFWLAARQRVSSPVFMVLTVILVLITVGLTSPFFSQVIRVGAVAPIVGHLFSWVWTGLAIHGLVLYYGATVASQRLAEDRQSGALELILSAPGTERSLSRGLWLAYGRRMFFPALVAVLIHGFCIWQVLNLMVADPPSGQLPPNVTPGQIFWSAVLGLPLKGQMLDWEFGMILRCLLFALFLLMANWIMLGWLGRWLGLRMKHPGFAPMCAVALALAPPTLLFGFVCYVFEQFRLFRMPERQMIPMMTWVAVGIAMTNCLLLGLWAARHLRHDLRRTVAGRYEPVAPRSWWRGGWRIFRRLAVAGAALALVLGIMVALFYGYQNWQTRRQWAAFQKQLQLRGESLDLAPALPGPVPEGQNFVQSPAFQNFLNRKPSDKTTDAVLKEALKQSAIDANSGPAVTLHASWMQQVATKLGTHAAWLDPKFIGGTTPDRQKPALRVLEGLDRVQNDLRSLEEAARLPYFRAMTNSTAAAVYESNRRELAAMEQLQLLFQLRACARLALNRSEEAGQDVLTTLRLAGLVQQSPDIKSSTRVQVMLARSLQPLWEGLAELRWTEAQLAVFQKELAGFDLLANHTNALHRVMLAHVETWRAIPENRAPKASIPQAGGVFVRRSEWGWQPGVWWFNHCMQLHEASRKAIARVDAAAGRVSSDFNWSDLNGLPLDGFASQLFQQALWWGNSPTLVSSAQTAVNQAIIACALERHRLAHGAYPETLDQLVPAFLGGIPRDISRGRMMFYQREGTNSYALRGAGMNGTIDATSAVSDDWLWSFTTPTNKPAAGRAGRVVIPANVK